MKKLDFDFQDGEYTAEFKKCKITVSHDDCSENPWEAWDCEPPLLTYGNRDYTEKDYSENGILTELLDIISANQIIKHQNSIAEAGGIDISFEYYNYPPQNKKEKVDCIIEEINNISEFSEEYINIITCLCDILKIEYLETETIGYCQGDYVALLFVALPSWIKKTGVPKKSIAKQLEGAKKLFSAWAWGNTYFYSIEDEYGEEIGSCGGFYGDCDDEEDFSGIQEAIIDEIESHIEYKRKKSFERGERLKKLFAN